VVGNPEGVEIQGLGSLRDGAQFMPALGGGYLPVIAAAFGRVEEDAEFERAHGGLQNHGQPVTSAGAGRYA
jgi:hypothetical protein